MNPDQIAAIEANSYVLRDANVRAVSNGYVISLSRRYMDIATNNLLLQAQNEVVASNNAEVLSHLTTFFAG